MTTITIPKELNKTISMIKIGKEPVVLVSLKLWQKLKDLYGRLIKLEKIL